ncbi:MAG TPA: dihydrolipoyllysine-residue acetyltransferase [Candidatus Sulfotelmatobacter sp.]|nr:dihydrolipoyllysine-residue acetyltransferase [Candidatus Sulfotelmatobacter sp.]
MATIELKVPDLGDFHDIPVIEVLVQPGESVAKDAALVTLESDKATMEVPASNAGTIRELKVKVGDKVSAGTVIATVESADSAPVPAPVPGASAPTNGASAAPAPAPAPAPPPAASGEGVVELRVPDLGDFHDIPVIEVLVQAGESVAKDAALVTLESDKATMEVPASSAGTIREIKVKVGDKVSAGTVIATATTNAPVAAAAPSIPAPAAPATPAPAPPPAAAAPAAPAAGNGKPSTNGLPPVSVTVGPVHASPAIRRFARELGVDLGRVRGSGPNGRITRDDVQGFVKGALAAPTPSAPTAGAVGGFGLHLPPWPSVDFAKFGPIDRVPLTRIQKISGPALARNWVMIPHVTQNEDADVTELEAFRKQVNGERKDVKVTMLAFLIKAVVAALQRYPVLNSSLDGEELVLKRYYHIGFAADTPQGLVVPVVKDADKKGILELARETADLAAKARDGKLGPNDINGATFTISSLGSIGGTYFTPIINAPEVAILGAARAEIRPVWDGAAFVPRLIQPLSLSYDHRVVDGALAVRFCVALKEGLGDLRRTLL